MSLLDQVLANVQDQTPAWVDRAVTAGKGEAALLPPEARPSVLAMLDKLSDHRDDIASYGADVYALMLMHLKVGSVDQARLVYLATVASQDERMDAMDKATNAAEGAHVKSDEAWAKAKKIGEDILLAGGEAALPVLFTVLRAL
jgi:hypothetical protein